MASNPAKESLSGLGRQAGWTRSVHWTSSSRLTRAMSSANWRVTYDGCMTIWLTRNNFVCWLPALRRLCSATLTWICDALRLSIYFNEFVYSKLIDDFACCWNRRLYLRTQWAAVRIHRLLMSAPPQKCSPFSPRRSFNDTILPKMKCESFYTVPYLIGIN